jgi:probable addiction module antidote protein
VAITTTPYDNADYLESDEEITAYIDAVFEDGDPSLITHALGVVARARGIHEVAKEAGISQVALDKALDARGGPDIETVVRVLRARGLRLAAVPAGESR